MNVENYLPKSSQDQISAAVKEAEQKVQAEIVPVFMTESDDYDEAALRGAIGGAAFTSLAILLYDHLMGWYQFFLLKNDWLFISSIVVGGLLGYLAARYIPFLKRLLVSKDKMKERSTAMAERVFGEYKIAETSSRTGILIFISLFEHHVRIIPDKHIKEKVADDEWQSVIDKMKPALKNKKFDEAFIKSVKNVSDVLLKYDLKRTGDASNELPDHLRRNI